jgi:uncharacterized Zn-binding protein involved in type VI secretion
MKPAAARHEDLDTHKHKIKATTNNVFINGKPIARKDDTLSPAKQTVKTGGKIGTVSAEPEVILKGSATVYVNGKPLARVGDEVGSKASTPANKKSSKQSSDGITKITTGSTNVFVG